MTTLSNLPRDNCCAKSRQLSSSFLTTVGATATSRLESGFTCRCPAIVLVSRDLREPGRTSTKAGCELTSVDISQQLKEIVRIAVVVVNQQRPHALMFGRPVCYNVVLLFWVLIKPQLLLWHEHCFRTGPQMGHAGELGLMLSACRIVRSTWRHSTARDDSRTLCVDALIICPHGGIRNAAPARGAVTDSLASPRKRSIFWLLATHNAKVSRGSNHLLQLQRSLYSISETPLFADPNVMPCPTTSLQRVRCVPLQQFFFSEKRASFRPKVAYLSI